METEVNPIVPAFDPVTKARATTANRRDGLNIETRGELCSNPQRRQARFFRDESTTRQLCATLHPPTAASPQLRRPAAWMPWQLVFELRLNTSHFRVSLATASLRSIQTNFQSALRMRWGLLLSEVLNLKGQCGVLREICWHVFLEAWLYIYVHQD
jgi:hypothetical protein